MDRNVDKLWLGGGAPQDRGWGVRLLSLFHWLLLDDGRLQGANRAVVVWTIWAHGVGPAMRTTTMLNLGGILWREVRQMCAVVTVAYAATTTTAISGVVGCHGIDIVSVPMIAPAVRAVAI